MKSDLIIRRETTTAIDEVCQRIPAAAQKYKFGVIGTHDLKEKMTSKGVPFDRECRVFEVCNPQQAKNILSLSMEMSSVLPCRIAVYEDAGHTVLATIKPTLLVEMFGVTSAGKIAKEVEDTLTRIMEDAAQQPGQA